MKNKIKCMMFGHEIPEMPVQDKVLVVTSKSNPLVKESTVTWKNGKAFTRVKGILGELLPEGKVGETKARWKEWKPMSPRMRQFFHNKTVHHITCTRCGVVVQ